MSAPGHRVASCFAVTGSRWRSPRSSATCPLAVRILGEDLVVFRDLEGRVGVLHRHCCHRGASLEFGIVSQRGIRCCYHGWLFDVDGVILETPGEPHESPIRHTASQGAYPAREFGGLVFAYMGPPGSEPPFPCFDTYEQPDNRLIPFSLWHPCNWLQLHENMMDPVHAVFLHTRVAGRAAHRSLGRDAGIRLPSRPRTA